MEEDHQEARPTRAAHSGVQLLAVGGGTVEDVTVSGREGIAPLLKLEGTTPGVEGLRILRVVVPVGRLDGIGAKNVEAWEEAVDCGRLASSGEALNEDGDGVRMPILPELAAGFKVRACVHSGGGGIGGKGRNS